jgi:hypothetical protein
MARFGRNRSFSRCRRSCEVFITIPELSNDQANGWGAVMGLVTVRSIQGLAN